MTADVIPVADAVVDLALVLAVDCSASVHADEVALQMDGIGRAFHREDVQAAIKSGKLQRVAVSVVQWSGWRNQATVIPWAVLSSADEADRFAAAIAAHGRELEPTATSISGALLYAGKLLEAAPNASRQVVDVSADGPNNIGPPVRTVRDKLVQGGVTINGLAIRHEWRHLNVYLEMEVAGGAGHFVEHILNYEQYADAIYKKLLREITAPATA